MSPWMGLLLLAALLQSSLLWALSVWGVHPTLMLSIVLGWSLLRGGREGLLWALVGGGLLDLLSAAPFGTFTVALLTIAFLSGLIEQILFHPPAWLPVVIMLLASPLFHFISLVMMQSLGWPVNWARLGNVLLPAALLDAFTILLLFPLLRRASALAGERAIEWAR